MLTFVTCRSHVSCGRKGLAVVFVVLCVAQGVLVGYYTFSDDMYKFSMTGNQQSQRSDPHQLKSYTGDSSKNDQPPSIANPSQVRGNCSDGVCLSNLAIPSQRCYNVCEELAYLRTEVPASEIPKRCKFRAANGHTPVALVSVPGSGNTWVRGLLEKATGICTGSIYCDAPLRNMGFIGEYIHDGSVLVVKTHTSDYQWLDRVENRNQIDAFYGSAILLVRSPFDTFVAERQRSIRLNAYDKKQLRTPNDSSHVYQASRGAFGEFMIILLLWCVLGDSCSGNNSDWNIFVHEMSIRWQKTIVKWSTSGHSVLVVRYEDLKKDYLTEVVRMLDFLKQNYMYADLVMKLRGGFDLFKRKHSVSDQFEHYTKEQKIKINTIIRETTEILKKHESDHLFQLRQYLTTNL